MEQVFFAVPVRNRSWCLDKYLEGLKNLEYPRSLLWIHFLVNDSQDETFEKLVDFGINFGNEFASYIVENKNYGKPEGLRRGAITTSLYPHYADMKNYLLEKFLETPCEYWLQVDSDSPCRPDTLRRLLRHREGYVAGICNVDASQSFKGSRSLSNVMRLDSEGKFRRVPFSELEKVPDGGLFEADWVGGISLIRRDIAVACRYHVFKQGKDDNMGFCHNIQQMGKNVWVDPSVYLDHYMRKGVVW